MMTGRILLATALLVSSATACAAWDAGVALEDYQWMEYPEGIHGTPREAGLRSALLVNWMQEGDRGALFAWRARLYGGTVNYDTFLISNGAPVSTKTDYGGVAAEGQMFYRDDLWAYKLDLLGGLGLDFWRRSIRNASFNQIEDFAVWFMRGGVRLSKPRKEAGLHGEFGFKYPFSVGENAHLTSLGYTSNPTLSPKGEVSGYAEIGYRINAKFDVTGYYDSWRFGRSNDVMATDTAGVNWLIHQPKSRMDATGIKLLVSF